MAALCLFSVDVVRGAAGAEFLAEMGGFGAVGAGLGLAMLFGLLASRLRIPPLVGYLLAGVTIGPGTPGFVADVALAGQLADDASVLQQVTGLFGTVISGVFLLLIGVINLFVLIGIARVFGRIRTGTYDEASLERQLQNRGLVNRMVGRLTGAVTRPWRRP